MKKKQYKTPLISVFELRTTLLSGSETMDVDSTNKVNSDDKVFSRQAGDWFSEDDQEE